MSTAIHAGSPRTFVGALKSADLVNTLEGKGPFTVFATTDAAFARPSPGPRRKGAGGRGRGVGGGHSGFEWSHSRHRQSPCAWGV